ncbi:MAG: adenylate/guanylate cyclase domain-containing protein [Solirubrobacteraceae bacterium]
MIDPVDRAVRAIVRRNSFALVWAQHLLANVIMLFGLGLLALYQPMSAGKFLVLAAVSQGLVALDNVVSIRMILVMWRPVRAWERGARHEAATIAAWRTLASLPIEYLRRVGKAPFLFAYLPFIAFTTWELDLSWYLFWILAAAGTVVLAYSLIVRYFTMEIVVRPVLEEVARELPPDFIIDARGLPLRWRLLAVAPVINVITGVVVAGLSANGHHATLDDLGLSWLIAVGVSFTISLELTILVVRTLVTSLDDLHRATDRIAEADYSARVPVVSADETGELAQSFNLMAEGLDERERLREALGAYVDPEVAERILKEGPDLAGEETEASILFLDIRDFTAFAERAQPAEVVALLNKLWALVVPVLLRHGGHANKFIGDGLLGVFGAPEPHPDHAARAVRAALEIVHEVRTRYQGRIAVGIGVNTGSVVAGTVGGGGRVEFTVIGDAVNTASRVEKLTREIGDDVLITEATCAQLSKDEFALEQRQEVAVRGKQAGVRLWAPRPRGADNGSAGARRRARAAPVSD